MWGPQETIGAIAGAADVTREAERVMLAEWLAE